MNAKRTSRFSNVEPKSLVLNAVFGGAYRIVLCADNCAVDNILDSHTVMAMKKVGVEYKLEDLIRYRKFDIAASLPNGKQAVLTCNKALVVDTELLIRHGTALNLRVVRWLVTD